MLQVPRRVEYALRAIVTLAGASPGERLSFKDIADTHDIPRDYLAKILRQLVDAEIIESRRGANGGYRLARSPADVSFLEIIEAADSPVAVNLCTENGIGCCHSADCVLATVWQRAENAMRDVFATTALADVLATPLTLAALERGAPQPQGVDGDRPAP